MNTRTTEIMKIFTKLNELNLGISCYEEFITFREIYKRWVPRSWKNKNFGNKENYML